MTKRLVGAVGTSSAACPRRGGRVLCVHGDGSVHAPSRHLTPISTAVTTTQKGTCKMVGSPFQVATGSFSSCRYQPDGPPPRTAPGNPPGAAAETRTASGVAESCPPPAPGTQRPLPVSERPCAQHLHHHPRLIRRVATAVPLVQSVERRQIQTVHQIADMVRQVALRQPLPNVGRQQQRLVRHIGAECCRGITESCGSGGRETGGISFHVNQKPLVSHSLRPRPARVAAGRGLVANGW